MGHPVREQNNLFRKDLERLVYIYLNRARLIRKVRKWRKVERLLTWMTMSWEEQGQDVYRNTHQIIIQGTDTVGCLSQEGRHQTDARMFMIWVMIHWQQHAGLMGPWTMSPEGKSCEETEGMVMPRRWRAGVRKPPNLCEQGKRMHVFFAQLMEDSLFKVCCPNGAKMALKGCSNYKGCG